LSRVAGAWASFAPVSQSRIFGAAWSTGAKSTAAQNKLVSRLDLGAFIARKRFLIRGWLDATASFV